MNRNKKADIEELSKVLSEIADSKDIVGLLTEILTKAELDTLSKRWRILNMITAGMTQRDIAKELQVSLCKVTRGSKILKNKNSIAAKYLTEGKK